MSTLLKNIVLVAVAVLLYLKLSAKKAVTLFPPKSDMMPEIKSSETRDNKTALVHPKKKIATVSGKHKTFAELNNLWAKTAEQKFLSTVLPQGYTPKPLPKKLLSSNQNSSAKKSKKKNNL